MKAYLVKKIIEKYTFSNKKKEDVDFCPCYKGNKCHDIEDDNLICTFCYCPEYEQNPEIPEGKCRIKSGKGYYFHHPNLSKEGILDCSSCNIPQTKEFVKNYFNNLPKEKLRKILNINFKNSKSLFDFLIEM